MRAADGGGVSDPHLVGLGLCQPGTPDGVTSRTELSRKTGSGAVFGGQVTADYRSVRRLHWLRGNPRRLAVYRLPLSTLVRFDVTTAATSVGSALFFVTFVALLVSVLSAR